MVISVFMGFGRKGQTAEEFLHFKQLIYMIMISIHMYVIQIYEYIYLYIYNNIYIYTYMYTYYTVYDWIHTTRNIIVLNLLDL